MTRRRPDRDAIPAAARRRDLEGLVAEVARARITRRQFVERALYLGLSAGAVGGLLAACGGDSPPTEISSSPSAALPRRLRLLNWSDFLAPRIKRDFEREYGMRIVETYIDELGDDLGSILRTGTITFDIMVLSDYMVSVARSRGYLEPLQMDRLPNFGGVSRQFEHPVYDDPDNQGGERYSVPYQWGTAGYAVRTDRVESESVGAWAHLWERRFKGRIQMLNDERETLGVGLMKVGYEQDGAAWSVNTTVDGQLEAAKLALIEQKPLVRTYDSVNPKRAIVEGVPLVHCWDGDARLAAEGLGLGGSAAAVDYVLPSEGFGAFADSMVIPAGSARADAAHLFIDYMLRPEVQAELSDCTRFLPVVTGAAELADPVVSTFAPSDDDMARAQFYDDLGDYSRYYTEAWAEVKSA